MFARGWFSAISVLATAFALGLLTHAFLGRFRHGKRIFIGELAPSIGGLIYLLGLRVFFETAPLDPHVAQWVENTIYVISVVIFLNLIRRAAWVSVQWGIRKSSQSATLQQGFIPLLRNVITLFFVFTGGIMILKHFNYDVMSLLAALGVGSLAVGLAAKDTLTNMISGFTLIIDRNLSPGDRINLAGTIGDVEEIGLRSTRLRIPDGNTLIVPNSELVNTKILNLSMPNREMSCSIQVRVPLNVPFAQIREIANATFGNVSKIRRDRERWVNLTSLSEGNQLVTIGFWVSNADDQGEAVSEFNAKLLENFKNYKVALAAPGQPAADLALR